MPLSNLSINDAFKTEKPSVQRVTLVNEDAALIALARERLASPQNTIAVSLEGL